MHWLVLFLLSALFAVVLQAIHLPAALLLGPMAAAMLLAGRGATLRLPRTPFLLAQGCVGGMIGRAMTPRTFDEILGHWLLFVATVLTVIIASGIIGWILARFRILPARTAVWGSSPGGATAMTMMAADYGADVALVALMQYLRVVFVVLVAAVVMRLAANSTHVAAVVWLPSMHWSPFLETILVIGLASAAGAYCRIPAGSLLLPMAVSGVLNAAGLIVIELPPWLLAPCYALIGWNIGLKFSRAILAEAVRALPAIIASNLVLIALCGLIGAALTVLAPIDPLTAFLATCPGGIESIAIIASSSQVDLPFVMAMQAVRVILVLVVGPSFARLVSRSTAPKQ